ncbi:zinc metalloprotease, partial [Flavobacterium oreochromis]
ADTKIAVEFTNITINTSYQLIKGVVETSYNPQAPNISDVEDLSGGNNNQNNNQNNTPILNFPITNVDAIQVNISQGTINITAPNGQITSVPLTPNQPTTLITDNQGNGYEVNNTTGEVKPVNTISEVVTAEEQAKAEFKFEYKGVEFLHKDKLATMLHGKELKIEIKKKNEQIKINTGKAKIKLEDKELNLINESGKFFVTIKADATTLKKEKSKLVVLDSIGKTEMAILNIVTYTAPVVKFSKPDNYAGEFLFDDGFERHTTLKSNAYYKSIVVGKKKEIYYAPVIGLNKGDIATIKVDSNDFNDIARKDPDFKLVFKPSIKNKIKMNKQLELEVSADDLKTLNLILIEALEYINTSETRMLDPILIEVFVKETNENVGIIEYYCSEPIKKQIHLIYTKFKDDKTYPAPFTNFELQNFLNKSSHNQLFIEYVVQSENFEVNEERMIFVNGKNSTNDFFYGLKREKFPKVEKDSEVPEYDYKKDYYFVTDIEKAKTTNEDGSAGSYLGGAHWIGSNGGIHLKTKSPIGETQIELAAHEFGHWIGLPHTFEEKDNYGNVIKKTLPFITIHNSQGESKFNFMDYQVNRKTWFKIQLLNNERTSN